MANNKVLGSSKIQILQYNIQMVDGAKRNDIMQVLVRTNACSCRKTMVMTDRVPKVRQSRPP